MHTLNTMYKEIKFINHSSVIQINKAILDLLLYDIYVLQYHYKTYKSDN